MNNKKTSSWNLGVKGYIVGYSGVLLMLCVFRTDIRFPERNT